MFPYHNSLVMSFYTFVTPEQNMSKSQVKVRSSVPHNPSVLYFIVLLPLYIAFLQRICNIFTIIKYYPNMQ